MAVDSLILVANPGSASRKYALYSDDKCLIKIHFELLDGKVIYTSETNGEHHSPKPADISHLTFAGSKVFSILQSHGLLSVKDQIKTIALRVVAPSSYFQQDRVLDKQAIDKLTDLEPRAQLHINAGLQEVHLLKQAFPEAVLLGISDSAFHHTMPDHASGYALPFKDTDKLDIKRFGYHGLSAESVVKVLRPKDKLPLRLVICHLGSGASVTAVKSGKSIDTTMGYSPLEGLMMSTRSGSIDVTAAQVLQDELKLSSQDLQEYLNHKSGLLGVSGTSADIKVLLELERDGDSRAKLALDMYIYRVQQAIGQMVAALGGVDALVFTGTVGERSVQIRRRVTERLMFLGLQLNPKINHGLKELKELTRISPASHPAKVYVVPADEYSVIVSHARKLS
ncbi:acetate/propionate family kinase [Candidatus Saccharibacteria bacterium]|nr:acetate/propionate family kinase [Candidatus Saccharibacteria bacterium]